MCLSFFLVFLPTSLLLFAVIRTNLLTNISQFESLFQFVSKIVLCILDWAMSIPKEQLLLKRKDSVDCKTYLALVFKVGITFAFVMLITRYRNRLRCIVASSVAETRDRTLSSFQKSRFYEVVSRCLPHQWEFYGCTLRNRIDNSCFEPPCLTFFIESFLKMYCDYNGCRIGYVPTKNELRSLAAVVAQGHQRGGFCILHA